MKSLALAAALAAAATPTLAGGFAPVVVAPAPVVVAEPPPAPRSTWGVLLPLLLLGALVLIAQRDDDDPDCADDEALVDGECVVVTISDARLKTDIARIGTSPSGLPIYSFHYIGVATTFQGVMAQDLLSRRPEAVVHGPFGVLAVDYSGLDVEFRALD